MINSQYISKGLNHTFRLKSRKHACPTAKDLIENQFNGQKNWRANWSISNPERH